MPEFEFERYELKEGPAYRFDVDRRDFFKVLGGGVVLFLVLDGTGDAQESGRGGRGRGEQLPQDVAAWLHIDESGIINVYTGKTEVGQNIRTSLTQAVAEELHAPVGRIRLVMADTDVTPFDMGTFGSRTTPTMAPQLRKVAVAARELLIDMAAEKWKTDRAGISIVDGQVRSAKGDTARFEDLTKGQKLARAIGDVQISAPQGKSVVKVNAEDTVTGRHRFTSDVKRPGMLYGHVVRPTAFNAKLASIDSKAAESMAGVTVVRDGDFAGVAAPDARTAARAVEQIKADWQAQPQPSAKELFGYLKSHPAGQNGSPNDRGSIEEGLRAADHKLESTYTVAYIAHVPLEPRAAVAEWNGDRLTVWTGTQRPFGVRGELAQAFNIPESRVRVIVPDTGSGYGGKHTGEAAIEAARLAKGAGKPVKLVWTREEEFTWAYFRPAGVIDVRSGVRSDGTITAWEFHNYNSGASGIQTNYDIPNQRIQFHATEYPLRQGSYRGLAATANHFARESHMDEMAHAVNLDPLAFRLKNLKDARLRGVLEVAAERFGWGKSKGAVGLAGGFEKGGYVATCAEIAMDAATHKPRVIRAVTAFDCGAVVNPEHLKNQIEGSMMMGIGGALFEAVDFDNGRILNPRLSRYRVPRFSDMPVLEAVLVDRKDLPPAGAGETPIVGIAPAIANAIFAATGERRRTMPLKATPSSNTD